jgi:hypothetical protein
MYKEVAVTRGRIYPGGVTNGEREEGEKEVNLGSLLRYLVWPDG